MPDKPQKASTELTKPVYQVTVRGKLKEDWREWFNGTLIPTEGLSEGNPTTTFTCRMRDQAELIGILNWLHNINMVIEMVCLIPNSSDRK